MYYQRWKLPTAHGTVEINDFGMVPGKTFLKVAERSGHAVEIALTADVCDALAEQLREHAKVLRGHNPLR